MKNEKTKRRMALIRSTSLLLILVFLLTYATFSWIKREWSPKIVQDNISIHTSGALVFKFSHTGENITTSATVNEILGQSSFALKPVSSSSGMVGEFFNIEYGEVAGNETFYHLDYRSEGYGSEMTLGTAKGYVVLNFKLQLLQADENDTAVRYIYINPESYIRSSEGSLADVASAIRVSIHCPRGGLTTPVIIGTDEAAGKHCEGVANTKDADQKFIAHGEKLFDVFNAEDPYCEKGLSVRNPDADTGEELLETQDVHRISEFNGGDDHSNFDKSKILFQMVPGTDMDVTVCIWLEGEDPLCNDSVTDNKLDLRIQFSAYVEPEATEAE